MRRLHAACAVATLLVACAASPRDGAAPPPTAPPSSTPRPPFELQNNGLMLDVLPPGLVAAHRLPELSADAAAAVDRLFAPGARALMRPTLSADGAKVYFARTAPRWVVHRMDAPRGDPVPDVDGVLQAALLEGARVVERVGVRRPDGVIEGPTSMLFVDGGGAETTLYRAEDATMAFGCGSDAGGVYFATQKYGEARTSLQRWDRGTSVATLVGEWPEAARIVDEKDGALLVATAGGLFVYDVASKSSSAVAACAGRAANTIGTRPRFGFDRGEVIFQTTGADAILCVGRTSGSEPLPGAGPGAVARVDVHRADRRVVYTAKVGGKTELYVVADGSSRKVPGLPAGDVSLENSTADGRRTLLQVGTATAPASTYVYDWKSKVATVWHAPSLSPGVEPVEESCATSKGVIPLVVRRPPACTDAASRCPVVVDVSSNHGIGYSATTRIFEDAGFVSVLTDTPWDARPSGALSALPEVAACVRAWSRGAKVGVWGSGKGGYVALLAMTQYAGAFDAGAAIGGPVRLDAAGALRTVGLENATDEEKAAASPTTYVDRAKGPVLLVDWENGWDHPVGDTFQLTTDLEKRGVDVTMFFVSAVENADVVDRGIVLGHVLAFFERTLKPAP